MKSVLSLIVVGLGLQFATGCGIAVQGQGPAFGGPAHQRAGSSQSQVSWEQAELNERVEQAAAFQNSIEPLTENSVSIDRRIGCGPLEVKLHNGSDTFIQGWVNGEQLVDVASGMPVFLPPGADGYFCLATPGENKITVRHFFRSFNQLVEAETDDNTHQLTVSGKSAEGVRLNYTGFMFLRS